MKIEFSEIQSDFLRLMKIETGIPMTIFIRQLVQNAMIQNDSPQPSFSTERVTTTTTRQSVLMKTTRPKGIPNTHSSELVSELKQVLAKRAKRLKQSIDA